METNKTKYDTNPLDPDVEKNADDPWGFGGEGALSQEVKGPTSEVGKDDSARQNIYSEAPTRRMENTPGDTAYPSVFIPPTYAPPTQFQPAQAYQPAVQARPTSRPVQGIGLPEKWALMLPYAPFYVGLIVSLIELFLVPRKEPQIRFHASQALALHIAILIVHTVFGMISTVTGSSLGGFLFKLAAFIFLIISMARVWQGNPHRIAPLAEPAQWFNDHIEPRNQG